MMRIAIGYTVLLGAVMTVGGAMAQVPNASSGEENHALDKVEQAQGTPDQVFLKAAIEGNNSEIDLAKIVLRKTKNEQVKQFAQKLVDDHTAILADLHEVEHAQTLQYKDMPNAMGLKLHAKLERLNGAAFDKAYINGMVVDHEGDVKDFTKEAETGKNPAIRAVAEKALPVIKEHLEMVLQLQKTIG